MVVSVLVLVLVLPGCGGEAADSGTVDPVDAAWAAYAIEPPAPGISSRLIDSPFLWPEQACVDAEGLALGDDVSLSADVSQLCAWDSFSGNVPEGLQFTEVLSCDRVFTQGPSWFTPPGRVYTSDSALLDDADYERELAWASAQIEASGCACIDTSRVDTWPANSPCVRTWV